MNHPVSRALENANQAQQLANLQRNEAEMREALKRNFGDPPVYETPTRLIALSAFINWCEVKGVRSCPAQPAAIAQFILENAASGIDAISEAADHIASAHEMLGLANPVATWIVAEAMDRIGGETETPRSWPKEHKWRFTQLPCILRRYLSARDREQEQVVRRAQNEAATARKELAAIQTEQVNVQIETAGDTGRTNATGSAAAA